MFLLACVAGGIVTAREIKFWQASGEAARRMGSGTFESGTLGSGISRGSTELYFARTYNTASYAGYVFIRVKSV